METTATKDQLLDVAEELFASQGFARTTIKRIASGANVNPALIYYYFTDKEALYGAVLQRMVGRIIAMGTAALGSTSDPVAAVRAVVAGQAHLLSSNRGWMQILVRELLDAEHSRVGEQARRLASSVFAQLCATIRRGQEVGAFRADIDARFAAISLIGQQVYFYLAHPAVRILLEHEGAALDDTTRAAFAEHVAEFSLAALRPPARSAA
jgi:AcrR family transcriptional regulator